MNDLSLSKLTVDLSEEDLKLILIALDSLNSNIQEKETRTKALLSIYQAEEFFNFDVDVHSIVTDPLKFLSSTIGNLCDSLYDGYYELASSNGTLKPIKEDNRVSHKELFDFLEVDLMAIKGVNA